MNTLGQKLLAYVIPKYFANRHDLHLKSKIAYSTLDNWHKGDKEPTLEAFQRVAETAKIPIGELLMAVYGPGMRVPLAEHPQWAKVVDTVRHRYAGKLPEWVYVLTAQTTPAQLPETLTIEFVADLAKFWLEHGQPNNTK